MQYEQRVAEITQNDITWPEADRTPREPYHWLRLKEQFFTAMRQGYCRLDLTQSAIATLGARGLGFRYYSDINYAAEKYCWTWFAIASTLKTALSTAAQLMQNMSNRSANVCDDIDFILNTKKSKLRVSQPTFHTPSKQ